MCADGWTGSKCLSKIYACHVSCDGCDVTSEGGAHECTGCYPGHTLSADPSGYCLPCHESCKECVGMASNECTACFDGFYGENGDGNAGQCLACHPACATCTGADISECDGCAADSTLVGGYCECNDGNVRHDTSFECVPACATCEILTANGVCSGVDIKALQFDFSAEAPLTSLVKPEQTANWCKPHSPIVERGGFFDGATQSLLVSGFEMYRTFTLTMIVRALNLDVSLMSA